jgi:acyl-CoA synthetase (AMP-forming)/AMP-acid ligase II
MSCRPGAIGEVVGRSGAMMTNYHGQPARRARPSGTTRRATAISAPATSGRFDEEGFLTLMDRRKDMVISGGFNVYPSDLEAVLRQHPQVADAAVVGVPSKEWGESPVAFVVARAGAPTRRLARLGQCPARQDAAAGRPALPRRAATQRDRQRCSSASCATAGGRRPERTA